MLMAVRRVLALVVAAPISFESGLQMSFMMRTAAAKSRAGPRLREGT